MFLFLNKLLMSGTPNNIKYQPNTEIEGECLLKTIQPVKLSMPRFILFVFVSVILVGIPALLVYWYPRFKRRLYYTNCGVQEATNFFIINYDEDVTYPEKEVGDFHKNEAAIQATGDKSVIFFVNRFLKYIVVEHGEDNWEIIPASYEFKQKLLQIQKSKPEDISKLGLKEVEAEQLRQSFGPGAMILPQIPIWLLFVKEIMRPLYLFIVFSTTLWFYELYYYYSAIIVLTASIGIGVNLVQTYRLNKKIYHMAYYETEVNVLRDGKVVRRSSLDLVPGDIVFLKEAIKIPFDGVVLEGSMLINECALTGESVPVVKKDMGEGRADKNSLIYEGTLLIQVNAKKKIRQFEAFRQQYGLPVCILKTNFITLKGQLIRIISFPKEKENIFERQSAKFLIFLFCLSIISYVILIVKLHSSVEAGDLVVKFLDLITITVPPGLPVSMTFGIIFALQKLKNKQIFCISPNKVVAGGMVDFVCFDKTGTLTEDFMDFWGFVGCRNSKFEEKEIKNDIQPAEGDFKGKRNTKTREDMIQDYIEEMPEMVFALNNMAVNHTIVQLEETKEFIGDPMEVKLFQFGEFQLKEGEDLGAEVVGSFNSTRGHSGIILKRYEFDSELFRMSTISTDTITKDGAYIYTKGSPQQMLKMQVFDPKTVPSNYNDMLRKYASMGFRVLAVGHRKVVSKEEIGGDLMSNNPKIIQILNKFSRLELESNLVFDGFEIFENRLKAATKAAIRELRQANIPCVMITGDNPLTAANIGYQSKISSKKKKTFILDFDASSSAAASGKRGAYLLENFVCDLDSDKKKKKTIVDDDQSEFDSSDDDEEEEQNPKKMREVEMSPYQAKQAQEQLLEPYKVFVEHSITNVLKIVEKQNAQLCMTGTAFTYIFGGRDVLQATPEDAKNAENAVQNTKKSKHQDFDEDAELYYKEILNITRIYARAKPNDKAKIVMQYQDLMKKTVAMCGDGANDCGALKQAHIGLSLSQTEASVAAPFTSQITDISSMVELLKECRAGLATNFSLFNIMALYSLIQYSTVVICQFYYSYPADFQFLYWDVFCNFFFFLTFGYTQTADYLSRLKPSGSLFTLSNILQVLLMFGIQLAGQILMIVALSQIFNEKINYEQTGSESVNHQAYIDNDNSFILDSFQTNILFLFTNLMYISTLMAFSISKPWRKEFYTNVWFMVVLLVVLTYSIIIIVVPKSRLSLFKIIHMDYQPMNYFVLGLSLGFGFFIYLNQKFVMEPLFRFLREKYPSKTWI